MKKLLLCLVLLLSCPVIGQAGQLLMPPPGNGLYDYHNTIALQDDFISGGVGGGDVGALGFSITGGSTSTITSENNRMGLIRRDTSAVINTYTSVSLQSNSSLFDPTLPHRLVWIVRINVNDANVSAKIGAQVSAFAITPGAGIYFEKLGTDTNWFCVTRSGGVETRTNSGVAADTLFNTFSYTVATSSVVFKINDIVVASHSSNMPSSFVDPTVAVQNLSAASKTFDIDYFELWMTGLSR